jgi:hypothetical protein
LLYEEIIEEKETERAWCFLFEKGLPVVWLPKSQVEDIRETVNEVDIPLWLVDAKGLEDYVR